VLGFLDQAVLWGNLGISLLVLVAGALLVPALGLVPALLATVLGAALGNALLGLAAVPASQTGVPTMVLYRAPLGVRGSLLPTTCNVVQNLGWATFELFVIASAAAEVSERVLDFRGRLLWVLLFGAISTALTLAGPLTVVRRYLERFAVWAVLASTAYLTWYALARFDLGRLATRPGAGGLNFWAGVDLAVALPISWVPLVADYARFSRSARAAFWGTSAGYFLAQVWCYALGILFLLGIGHGDVIAAVVAVPVGLLAMVALVVDEADEVFANLYSTVVSLQNAAPRYPAGGSPSSSGRSPPGLPHSSAICPATRASCSCSARCSCRCSGCWRPTTSCSPAAATTSPGCTGRTAPTGACAGRRCWSGWPGSSSTTGSTRVRWAPGCRSTMPCFPACCTCPSRCRRAYPGWARRCPPSRSPSGRCWPPGAAPAPHRVRRAAERPGPRRRRPRRRPRQARPALRTWRAAQAPPRRRFVGALARVCWANPVAAPGIPADRQPPPSR
jgi:putative hydroxymethylpyrimidine transporter CytX